ncbi:hypothetical protein FLGE108171_05610 [Flavobacterium gelidilacus]
MIENKTLNFLKKLNSNNCFVGGGVYNPQPNELKKKFVIK